jgi:hypothetical protein
LTLGSATPSQVTRLRIGSLSLQPAGLLGSLPEPLSENLMLRMGVRLTLRTILLDSWANGKSYFAIL